MRDKEDMEACWHTVTIGDVSTTDWREPQHQAKNNPNQTKAKSPSKKHPIPAKALSHAHALSSNIHLPSWRESRITVGEKIDNLGILDD